MSDPSGGGASAAIRTSPFDFSYDEFSDWFEVQREEVFEPARQTFSRLLKQRLAEELTEFDAQRIRLGPSRVKSAPRVWTKVVGPRYRDAIKKPEDVLKVVDDLVGIRIVCNNLSDVEYVQSIVEDFSEWQEGDPGSLGRERDSERQYIDRPKESGYRAYHVNLMTVVPQLHAPSHVRGELQIRTLLQDGWGELTHEDTYKPGVELPPLVVKLSRRMADLLAAVDDLAQDVRDELDRLAARSVDPDGDSPEFVESEESDFIPTSAPSSLSQALVEEAREVVDALARPATLAEIAQRLQGTFGTEIVEGWGGYGSFKALLLHAAPDAQIVQVGTGYVLPRGYDRPFDPLPGDSDAVPPVLRTLRRYDRNVPAISVPRMAAVIHGLSIALDPATWRELDIAGDRTLTLPHFNQLTRFVRDQLRERDISVNRQHLGYVIRLLMNRGAMRPGLEESELYANLVEGLAERARLFGATEHLEADQRNIEVWVSAAFEGAEELTT